MMVVCSTEAKPRHDRLEDLDFLLYDYCCHCVGEGGKLDIIQWQQLDLAGGVAPLLSVAAKESSYSNHCCTLSMQTRGAVGTASPMALLVHFEGHLLMMNFAQWSSLVHVVDLDRCLVVFFP